MFEKISLVQMVENAQQSNLITSQDQQKNLFWCDDGVCRTLVKNDLNKKVQFKAISSVPCFELWLLLHFEDAQEPLHRDDALARLQKHLPGYTKGKLGTYEATKDQRFFAKERAEQLPEHNGFDCFTDIHELVTLLTTLKS